jgi:putative ABC transport system permease protein
LLKRGLVELGAGLGLGLAGAWAGTAVLEGSLLIGVSPHDPLVFGAVPVLLAMVGLLACWLPARRAARVNPTEALRAE